MLLKKIRAGITRNGLLLISVSFLLCLPAMTRLPDQGVIAVTKLSRLLISIEALRLLAFFKLVMKAKKLYISLSILRPAFSVNLMPSSW